MDISIKRNFPHILFGAFLCLAQTLFGMTLSKSTLLEQAQKNRAKQNELKDQLKTSDAVERLSMEELSLGADSVEEDRQKRIHRIYSVRPPTPYLKEELLSPEENDEASGAPSKVRASILCLERLQNEQFLNITQNKNSVEGEQAAPKSGADSREKIRAVELARTPKLSRQYSERHLKVNFWLGGESFGRQGNEQLASGISDTNEGFVPIQQSESISSLNVRSSRVPSPLCPNASVAQEK